jgi:hypothetical protein
MPRGIDHLVIAVRSLDGAIEAYRRLGFTVSPKARHPFGTENAVVQLQGSYLELVAVADQAKVPEPTTAAFSFPAFIRDYLKKREGLAMLAVKGSDPAADKADFERHGLPTFTPVHFQRLAKGPDGIERTIAFTMTFTGDARFHGDAGFFTCQHHHPENFWRAEFQRHSNQAAAVASAVLVARDPADFHEFLTYLTGKHDMLSTSLGVTFDTGDGLIEVLSPVGFRGYFGNSGEPSPDPRRFMAMRLRVADLRALRQVLLANGVAFAEQAGQLVVPAPAAHGVTIGFGQA